MSRRNPPRTAAPNGRPMRFAHPFFTPLPHSARSPHPAHGGRMSQWIAQVLGPIPPAIGASVMQLDAIIGAQGTREIANNGAIRFHAVGDTGREKAGSQQEDVSIAMAADFDP